MKNTVYNPYLPSWEYVPDGEPHVFGDRLYVYGSHDRFGGENFCLNDYVCWSAPLNDLSDWKYEGVIYRKTQDPRNTDGKMSMNAPDCVQGPDGRYYLFYQLARLMCTCVAVASCPAGPFEYYGAVKHEDGTPWGEKKGDTFAFDPGALVDDDGKAWLYIGFAPSGIMKKLMEMRGNRVDGSVALQLAPDMLTVIGGEHPIVPGPKKARGTPYEGHAFYEASSIRKISGRYYYVYSSELSHELCYAVSDRPDGGFAYGGTLVSIADIGLNGNTEPRNYTGNTHGGMAEVNGQWYIFYHRQTNRVKCCRQGCAEKITILPDGSIPQAEVTSCGLNDGPIPAKGMIEARTACNLNARGGMIKSDEAHKKDKKGLLPYFTQSGGDRESNPDQYIANMRDGSSCTFKYLAFDGTEKQISVTVRGTGTGTLRVFAGSPEKSISDIALHPAQDYVDISAAVRPVTGTTALTFLMEGPGMIDFKEFSIQ